MSYLFETLKYLLPLVGVWLGWKFSQKDERKKIKYEEIKKIKKILFILLQIRNEIIQLNNIDNYIDYYLDYVKNNFTDAEINKNSSFYMRMVLKNLLSNIYEDNEVIDFKKQFYNGIENLSEIQPLLAYRIYGKQNIREYIDKWENEIKGILDIENPNEIREAINHLKPKLVDEVSADLSKLIKEVANLTNDGSIINDTNEYLIEKTQLEIKNEIEKFAAKMFDNRDQTPQPKKNN